jgi:glycosyltransferase involved in cell wall biosynthesis
MISVIVPNLNEAAYLRKFLLSMEKQTFKDFEIIVVDGESTDGSQQILEEFEQRGSLNLCWIIDETKCIGYVRNVGSSWAVGEILFHTSSDVILDPWILSRLDFYFKDPQLLSVTARTKPISDKILCHLAYQGFDLLRWLFTKFPGSMRKFRPGGNFFAIRENVFWSLGGFPEVCINEDGLLGQKMDPLLSSWKVKYDLGMCVHHHVKRFEERGSIKTILFYVYVFGNMIPMLKPFLYKIERRSAEVFKNRSDLRDFK